MLSETLNRIAEERIRDGYRRTRVWANDWIARINGLFYTNAQRRTSLGDPQAFDMHQQKLEEAIKDMADTWQQELLDDTLRPWQTIAAKRLPDDWQQRCIRFSTGGPYLIPRC